LPPNILQPQGFAIPCAESAVEDRIRNAFDLSKISKDGLAKGLLVSVVPSV